MPHHGAGAAQVPGAEAGEEQSSGSGLGAKPGPQEGWSCDRPQEGAHRAAAEAQEGPGGRDPEEDRTRRGNESQQQPAQEAGAAEGPCQEGGSLFLLHQDTFLRTAARWRPSPQPPGSAPCR